MKTKRTAEDLSAKRLLRRTLPAAFVLLAVVLAFTAPAAAAEDTSWYTGHESDTTFTLNTADQLAGLASLVNSGNTFEGKTVKLGGDITISGDWTPIGNATTTPFSGTFDGNGNTITFSLSVSRIESTDSAKPYGLFGVNSETIQNLGVVGSVTTASSENVYFGSIAGYNQVDGVITDCFSSCDVSLTISNSVYPNVGGIVGQNEGTLKNSYAVGDVMVTIPGSAYAGGIVGYNHNTIFNCYAAGNVTVTDDSSTSKGSAGGIAGCHAAQSKIGNITNCFALNEKITAINVERIAGLEINAPYRASPILSGNSAWADMTLNYATVTGGTAADKNGADVASEAVWNRLFEPFTEVNGWKVNEGNDNFQLPVLKNLDAPAGADASHLKEAAPTYTITFDANGGTGEMTAQTFTYDNPQALTANAFTKEGYTFAGWAKIADGAIVYTNSEEVSNLAVEDGAVVTLYAVWTENSGSGGNGGGGSPAPSVKPSTPTTPNTPEIPDTQKVTDETREIPTAPENIETLSTGDKVVVVALDNTEVIQSVAVPEAVAQANPEASVKVTEGGNAPALPENVAADDVHIVVGVSIVDKEGNPVKITESGYFILDADVPAGKKLVV